MTRIAAEPHVESFYTTLWLGALMLAGNAALDPFPDDLDELVGAGGGTTVLGSVTPFSADRSASFVLAVSAPARDLVMRGSARLRLAQQPIAADRLLPDPLAVTLGEPAWR